MKLVEPPSPHPDYPKHLFSSADGQWHIAINPVMFGCRVIAWHQDSAGPIVDYCAGDDPTFLIKLTVVIVRIFERMPDGISECRVAELMPRWERRPIDQDPCWPALQALATDSTPISADIE